MIQKEERPLNPKRSEDPDVARRIWDNEASKFVKEFEKNKGIIRTLVLGPGFPKNQLRKRRTAVRKLAKENYNVYIMEDLPVKSSFELHEKLEALLDNLSPDLIACVFTDVGSPHAVLFEIGFICGRYGFKKTFDRLRFIVHHKLDKMKDLPRYFEGIIARAEYYEYYDKEKGRTLYDRIKTVIQNEIAKLLEKEDNERD